MTKPQEADPRMHLRALEKTEEEIIKQLRPKEKEIRQLIEELKALRELIRATGKQVENFDSGTEEEKDKESEETIEALEDVVSKSTEESKKHPLGQNISDQYASVSAKNLTVAANTQTIDELYNLAYKANWSQDDAKKFFDMQYAISQTRSYESEISDLFKERVDNTYQALQQVWEKAQDQIKDNYKVEEQRVQQFQEQQTTTSTPQNKQYQASNFQAPAAPSPQQTYIPPAKNDVTPVKKKGPSLMDQL